MEESKVNIFIIDNDKKTYMIECPKTIIFSDFKKIITKSILSIKTDNFSIVFNNKIYTTKNNNDILQFENGNRVEISLDGRIKEAFFIDFQPNPQLKEDDLVLGKLTGILKLILIKYIANFIDNINLISNQVIREIIIELKKGMKLEESPQQNICSNLMQTTGGDIISYTKYVCSVFTDQEINNILALLEVNKRNKIHKYWSILTKYEEFNAQFGQELFKAIENSYFDYSLIGLSIYQQSNRNSYLQSRSMCPNLVKKYLFHGTQIDPISKIITTGFLYTRKAFYGMGIYFSDMLDYIPFYSGGNNYENRRENFGIILPVNSTFSCVGAEVYYNQNLFENVYDLRYFVNELDHFPTYEEILLNYKAQMVPKFGVHYARVEPNQGQVRNQQDIINDKRKGKFIGTEYVITEKDQILPLYGLTFKRNEYFVIWRDPNFKDLNKYSNFLNAQKLFLYKIAKMNAYFESSTEKSLEIIKKKKFNKIILITSVGMDLSGKKFVEIARKILGFDVVVLFFSSNRSNFSWLQTFPNALYTDDTRFFQKYVLNYNEQGLLKLKNEIQNHYGISLNFTYNFLQFPKFKSESKYENIIFDEPSPYFRKVIIKNIDNNCIFFMNQNRKPCFVANPPQFNQVTVNYYKWYVTMNGNEITLFSNGSYLGANLQQATGEQYMQRYCYEKVTSNEYIFYYGNKNYVLTIFRNQAILQNENFNRMNQKFQLIEISDSF